jgi:hypothetical protein
MLPPALARAPTYRQKFGGNPPFGAIPARSMRRRLSWLRCLRSRRPNDPDDGAKGDHFRSGGAGVGAGEGRGYPTMPMMVPARSNVVSRQLAGTTSPRDDNFVGDTGSLGFWSVMSVPSLHHGRAA